jgi:hypothetical protein
MKTVSSFLIAAVLLLGAGSSTFANSKNSKVTLSDFKGSYTGTVTFSVPAASVTLIGPVSVVFSARKSGKSGGIAVNGSVNSGGTIVPVAANIGLSNGAFSIDNFVFNVLAQGSFPGTGSYSRTKRAIKFTGSAVVAGSTYPYSGSIQTSTHGHKQRITFTDTVSIDGAIYIFTFNVSRHVKKAK